MQKMSIEDSFLNLSIQMQRAETHHAKCVCIVDTYYCRSFEQICRAISSAAVDRHDSAQRITTPSNGKVPSGSWAEDLIVRPNGQLLVILLTITELH